jgi:putative FmdB family regulatory protein
MPLYEYRCPECGVSFEKLRRMSEADQPAECPNCGANQGQLQLSTFATGGGCGPSGGGGGRFT